MGWGGWEGVHLRKLGQGADGARAAHPSEELPGQAVVGERRQAVDGGHPLVGAVVRHQGRVVVAVVPGRAASVGAGVEGLAVLVVPRSL